MQIIAVVPKEGDYKSLTSFGVLSSRVSIVLRDAKGRTSVGRDVLTLNLSIEGLDITQFFSSLGLSSTAFRAITICLVIIGFLSWFAWLFIKYRRREAVSALEYHPAKYDLLRKVTTSSSSSQ